MNYRYTFRKSLTKINSFVLFVLLFCTNAMGQSVIIGTGTQNTNHLSEAGYYLDPVDRDFVSSHMQFVYTAAELVAAGMPSGATITGMGYSISESAVSLTNYTISLGNTSQDLADTMIEADLTLVRPAFTFIPVVVPEGSFQMIPFTTGFVWNGTSNIVVNTCTGPNTYEYPAGGLRVTPGATGSIAAICGDDPKCNVFSGDYLQIFGYKPNIKFSYTTSGCSGTPAPGATTSTITSFCQNSYTLLGLQYPTYGSGVTYQWKFSANGSTYSNAPGLSTEEQYVTNVQGYYKCDVSCAGNTGTSVPLQVSFSSFLGCYCMPAAYYADFDYVRNITLSTLNNSSNSTDWYEDYKSTVPAPDLARGSTYPVSIQSGSYNPEFFFVYIDFNHDLDFHDAGEMIYLGRKSGLVTGTINIPANALTGNALMRVVGASNDPDYPPVHLYPCGDISYATVEDYVISIYQSVPCSGAPDATSVTPASSVICPGSTVTLALQTLYTNSGISFQWQKFNEANSLFENISGQNGSTYVASAAGQYRCAIACSNSGQTTYATPATLSAHAYPPTTNNNALTLDGVDDYVTIPDCGVSPIINGGDALTVEYWFKGSNCQNAVHAQSGGDYFAACAPGGRHLISWDDATGQGLSAGSGYNDGNWHHMAFTWRRIDPAGFRSYLDGQLIETKFTNSAYLPVMTAAMILGSLDGNSEFMNGSIDELRIWNVVRSQAQIAAGMCGVGTPQTGLKLYYKFDHGAAGSNNNGINTVENFAENQFHGDLSGFGLTGTTSNWTESTAGYKTWYADSDNDGYGNFAVTTLSCTQPAGYVLNSLDCNDSNPAVHPGVTEVCNGIDDNCNGSTDEGNVCCPAGILYVKTGATGTNTGFSWNDAFTSLQSALTSACSGVTQIWVAAGTYKPTSGTDRSASFVMRNNLAIYGGFNGTETQVSQRDRNTNVTILSGDLQGDDGPNFANIADNSFHVVNNTFFNGSPLNGSAILDGFTIRGGNANGGSNQNYGGGIYNFVAAPSISHCIISSNYAFSNGGGVYNDGSSSPMMTHCTFSGNRTDGYGGGMDNGASSSPVVASCIFSGNTANAGGGISDRSNNPTVNNAIFTGNTAVSGGAIYNYTSSIVLMNCSFSGNSASSNGGIMTNVSNAHPLLTNCILWGNSSSIEDFSGSSPTITYSIVQQASGVYAGTGNLNADPMFINGANGDLHLLTCSPAIDAGNDAATSIATDLDGNPRKFDAVDGGQIIDLGCYESQSPPSVHNLAVIENGPTSFCQGGSVTLSVARGGNGLSLSGNQQYLLTPNLKPAFPDNSMTVEIWFKADSHGVVATELDPPVPNAGWHDSQIEVIPDGHVLVRVWPLDPVVLGSISFGQWHHAVVRYNAATNMLDGFLDGVLSSGSVNGVRQSPGAQYWAFGATDATNLGSGAWFTGQFDEIRIWNTARSNADIIQNYDRTVAFNSPNLVAYYTLDQTTGTTAFDSSPNGYNGNLINSPAWVVPSSSPLGGSVLWSNSSTTPSIVVTQSGSYSYQVAHSVGCPDFSTNSTVSVTAIPNVSTNDFGQNEWIVYAWNAGGASSSGETSWNTNFSGYYIDTNLDFNSATFWEINGSPSDAPGYYGCAVSIDNHSFSAKRQGFPCGYYRLDVPGHDDEAQLLFNGTMVWSHGGCCDSHSWVWTGWLGATDRVEFRITEGGGQSYGHLAFTLLGGNIPPITTSNALNFDGIDDQVSISPCGSSTPLVNGGDAITVEYWFKGLSSQSAVRMQPAGDTYIVAAWANSIHILSNDLGTNSGLPVGNGFNDGNWHHIAFTWQRNTVNGFTSYLDGQVVAQRNSADSPLPVITGGLFLGALGGSSEFTNGSLDEVRIWNVARTPSQIRAGMCSLTLPQNGLVLYYSFDYGVADGSNTAINTIGNLAQPGAFDGHLGNFAMNGTASNWVAGSAREGIELQGGSPAITIENGDPMPGVADNTDFGSVADGSSLGYTYTIRNTGVVDLAVTSISTTGAGASFFSIGAVAPASPVPGYGSASFTVTFLPTLPGLQTATVQLAFSGCSPGEYTFAIQGMGTCAILAPDFRSVQNVTVTATSRFEAVNAVTVAGSGSLVTVAPGGNATFLAGAKVIFLPGTLVQGGGHLHGYIETGTICGSTAPLAPVLTAGEQTTESVAEKNSFSLYPNPTSGIFTLMSRESIPAGNITVEIYGLCGDRMLKESMTGEKRHEFDLSGIPAGLYFVKIKTGNQNETIKLVKTR
ncbi:MAG: MopE-related protein [Bacteroidetes bacterium]|nr:MopE-related protein [Bacteroidota bacterium]